MATWRGIRPWESQTFLDDQGIEDLWGYIGGMGPQQPAVPVAPVAPAAPAAQPAGPSPAAADPYAAIRNLQFTSQPTYRPISEDEWGYENTWEGSQRVAPAGAVQIMGDDGNMGWAMPSGQSYDFDWDTARMLENTPFRSKYSNVTTGPNGTMRVTLQQPDAHKYDTMEAIYAQDPTTGQWTLQNDPRTAPTRQVSTGESFFRDPLEQFGKDFVLPAVAMYTGAQFLAPYAAQATAALEGASAIGAGSAGGVTAAEQVAMMAANGMTDVEIAATLASQGNAAAAATLTGQGFGASGAINTLPDALSGMDLAADGGGNALWETGSEVATKTLPNTLPEVMAAEPGIPASSIAPVTPPAPLPALPSLNAAGSGASGLLDWVKANPKLSRGIGGGVAALLSALASKNDRPQDSAGGVGAAYAGPRQMTRTMEQGKYGPIARYAAQGGVMQAYAQGGSVRPFPMQDGGFVMTKRAVDGAGGMENMKRILPETVPIRGPGHGTSDSIPAYIQGKNSRSPAAVSNGEAYVPPGRNAKGLYSLMKTLERKA